MTCERHDEIEGEIPQVDQAADILQQARPAGELRVGCDLRKIFMKTKAWEAAIKTVSSGPIFPEILLMRSMARSKKPISIPFRRWLASLPGKLDTGNAP